MSFQSNMSSIIRICLSLTLLIALFDNILIRSQSSVQYMHAINDCYHLCFGIDSCEEECEKGFTRSRGSASYRSPLQDIQNFAQPLAIGADTIGKEDNFKARNVKKVKSFSNSFKTPAHCGLRFADKRSGAFGMGRIVGGQDAEPNEFPWLVSLQKKDYGKPPRHDCGAVILSEYYILTAAHCTKGYRGNLKQLVIKAGINSKNDPGQVIYPEDIIIHERWDDERKLNDLSLIRVKKPIKFTVNNRGRYIVNAICLPPDANEPKFATLAGWGQLGEDREEADWLQKITIPVWNRQRCRSNYKEYLGDSGGPLITTRGPRSYVIGVVSFGLPCAIKGLPGVYSNVFQFMDWISKHMT